MDSDYKFDLHLEQSQDEAGVTWLVCFYSISGALHCNTCYLYM